MNWIYSALHDLDYGLFRAIHVGWSNPVLDILFLAITSTGLGWVQLLVTLLWWSPWPKAKEWNDRRVERQPFAIAAVLAYSAAGLSNLIFKQIVPRERPSNLIWAKPKESIFFDSFPSGHSVTSFSIGILFFFMLWQDGKPKTGALFLVWAVAVGTSRVYEGVHWPTDVLGGAMVGLFWASAIYLINPKWISRVVENNI